MKKIVAVLTMAILFGCGMAEKGLDRKLNPNDNESIPKILESAINEVTPNQSRVIQQFIASGIYEASRKNPESSAKISIRDLVSSALDYELDRLKELSALKDKVKGIEIDLMTIENHQQQGLRGGLKVTNKTELLIDSFSVEGESTFPGHSSKIVWNMSDHFEPLQPNGGEVTIPILGYFKLSDNESAADLTGIDSETHIVFKNLIINKKNVANDKGELDRNLIAGEKLLREQKAIILDKSK